MAYTNVWDETAPLGSQAANLIDDDFRSFKLDIRQRLESIFGVGIFTTDPVSISQLKFTAANSKLVPGATTFLIRDAADANSNITIADGGAVNINRGLFTAAAGIQVNNGGIAISTGGISVGGNATIQNGAGPTFLFITNAAGQDRRIKFQTGGVDRFTIGIGSGAESGGNAGSDILFRVMDDAGSTISDFLTIVRATGISTFVKQVVINVNAAAPLELKSLSTSNNRLLRLTNTEASGKQWDLIVDTVAAGGLFKVFDNTENATYLQISTAGVVTIGNQIGIFPSGSFIDGSNQMDMGWNTNTFYFKQSIGTMRNIQFRTSANVDIFIIDLLNQKVTCSGVTDTATGYRIGNAAASGRFLRGDGTNFVSNTIQSGDLPTALTPTTLTVGGGQTVSRILSNSATWLPNGGAGIASGNNTNTTATVTGAQVGDTVIISNIWLADDLRYVLSAYVSALNTVTLNMQNAGVATGNAPTSRTVKIWVIG